mgnify:CR=1 FL=1
MLIMRRGNRSSRVPWLLLLITLLTAFRADEGMAQSVSASVLPETGSEVRGEARVSGGSEKFKGVLLSGSDGGFIVAPTPGTERWIDARSLTRLDVNRGRSAGAGASKGWRIGAPLVGLPFGLLVAGVADSAPVGFLFGAAAGGVAGSLLGAGIGAIIGADSWERIW